MGSDFFAQYNDPRWQRKRLEVMERADFTCQECGDKATTLNVHHGYYERGLAPWEYDSDSLYCLCEPCHKRIQKICNDFKRLIGYLDSPGMSEAFGYAAGVYLKGFPALQMPVADHGFAIGLGACFGLTAEEIIAELTDGMIDGYRLDALSQAKREGG